MKIGGIDPLLETQIRCVVPTLESASDISGHIQSNALVADRVPLSCHWDLPQVGQRVHTRTFPPALPVMIGRGECIVAYKRPCL